MQEVGVGGMIIYNACGVSGWVAAGRCEHGHEPSVFMRGGGGECLG